MDTDLVKANAQWNELWPQIKEQLEFDIKMVDKDSAAGDWANASISATELYTRAYHVLGFVSGMAMLVNSNVREGLKGLTDLPPDATL